MSSIPIARSQKRLPSPVTLLSSDCWLKILEHLSPKDYRSLLFVSKRNFSFAEPLLFREISLKWSPIPLRRLLLLFRAIIQRPERALEIRRLTLLSHQKVSINDEWKPPSCSDHNVADFQDVLSHAESIVRGSKLPDADTWTLALKNWNPYAFASIFISQLHNLKSLRLDYSFVWKSGFPGLMLRHALFSSESSLSKFALLEEVDYGANIRRDQQSFGHPEIYEDPGYPECNPDQFPAWFYLPSLRSLKIWLRTKQGIEIPEATKKPELPRLQRLILARTTIPESEVPKILSYAPGLSTLHLGMAYRWGNEIALKNGSYIIDGLKPFKGTLEDLSFGVEYFPPTLCGATWLEAEEVQLSAPFYGLIKEFRNLRSVEIPINMLAGWEADPSVDFALNLPDKVERLCLRADYHTIEEEGWHETPSLDLIMDNVARLRSHLPGLKQIYLRGCPPLFGSAFLSKKRDIARACCAEEGIDFEVVSDHLSNGIWTEKGTRPDF